VAKPRGEALNSTSLHTEDSRLVDVTSINLENLDISTRTRNCLIQANIETVGELASFTEQRILRIQNAGRKTLQEVREILGHLGLKLQGDARAATPANPKLLAELRARIPVFAKPDAEIIALENTTPDIQCRLTVRLSSCNTSVRAKGIFKRKKLTYIGDLVQLTFHDLMEVDNVGRRTANELSNLVSLYGFKLGVTIIGWCKQTAEHLEKNYASEHARERVEATNAFLSNLGPEPSDLKEELSRIVSALATGRNHSMLLSLWGFDGDPPKTLEAVGDAQTPRLTRERVRQIEATALHRLHSYKFDTPILRSALGIIRKSAPALGSEIDVELQRTKICSKSFAVESLRQAADILGINWPFAEVTISGERIVVHKDDEDRVTRLMQVARRRTSRLGCSNIFAVTSALKFDEEHAYLIQKVLDVTQGIRWLDEDKTWFFYEGSPRNRLFNLCAKVLGVCPSLSIQELRRAVGKSPRLSIAPPQKVLAAFVQATGLGTIQNSAVVADPTRVTTLAPDSVEGKFIEVFRQYGDVMGGEELVERCIEHGVNPTTFYIYRLASPVIGSLGRGIYCKVGADVPPGIIEEILSRRKSTKRSSDHGWLPNGNLWFGFEMTRIVLTAGSIRLVPFVSNLVQGDWSVHLGDGQHCGEVTCRESFIRSFKKAFAMAGIEPDDFVALEFDKKAREVHLRMGGPDLFEAIQATEGLDTEIGNDADRYEET
jgi:hypothetical protein